MSQQVQINKADDDKTYELTDIDTKFVSLVTAGANRQEHFAVVKSDDPANNSDDADEGDLGGWLEDFDKQVEEDVSFSELEVLLLESDDTEDETAKQVEEAEKAKDEAIKRADEAEKRAETLEAELDKAKQKIAALKSRAKNAEQAAKSARTKLTQLKKASVGGSTALVTGEGTAAPAKKSSEAEPPRRTAWRSGGDLTKG